MTPPARRAPEAVGWREWVSLPELCPVPMKAKVDTGARTSSLHAFDLSVVDNGAGPHAQFEVHPLQRTAAASIEVCCPIIGFRQVRSSTGHAEKRPVIRTAVVLGEHSFDIDITLTSRDAMGFRMLLGRSAIRKRFVVDAGRSYLHRRNNS